MPDFWHSDHHLNIRQEKVSFSEVSVIQMFIILIPTFAIFWALNVTGLLKLGLMFYLLIGMNRLKINLWFLGSFLPI